MNSATMLTSNPQGSLRVETIQKTTRLSCGSAEDRDALLL